VRRQLALGLFCCGLLACLGCDHEGAPCGDDYQPHCDGDTLMSCNGDAWPDPGKLRGVGATECSKQGRVCVEGNASADCVLPSRSACTYKGWGTATGCTQDGGALVDCSETGFVHEITPCAAGTQCVSPDGLAACVLTPLRPCLSEGWDCDADRSSASHCNEDVGYYSATILCASGEVCIDGSHGECYPAPGQPCVGNRCSTDALAVIVCDAERAVVVETRLCEGDCLQTEHGAECGP
jgi:hypothetical protein